MNKSTGMVEKLLYHKRYFYFVLLWYSLRRVYTVLYVTRTALVCCVLSLVMEGYIHKSMKKVIYMKPWSLTTTLFINCIHYVSKLYSYLQQIMTSVGKGFDSSKNIDIRVHLNLCLKFHKTTLVICTTIESLKMWELYQVNRFQVYYYKVSYQQQNRNAVQSICSRLAR